VRIRDHESRVIFPRFKDLISKKNEYIIIDLVDWLASRLVGCLVWLVGWLVGWLVSSLVRWLVG
jgi:hypothetical protein